MIARPVSYSLLVDEATLGRIHHFYEGKEREVHNEYVLTAYRGEKASVTVYKPKKPGEYRVLFQGPSSFEEAKLWDPSLKEESVELGLSKGPKIVLPNFRNCYPQIGSDETGTGNFFGPVEVAAAYITKDDLSFLEELGITDSKKMTDAKILEVTSLLLQRIPYSHLSLSAERYNEVHLSNNANAVKAKMHNACLLKLKHQYPLSTIYQDQFSEPIVYYSYLKNEHEIQKGIIFSTKGESKFPSVAAASVIARYSLLKKMDALDKSYGVHFPFGAGKDVDLFARDFLDKFGLEALKKVSKTSFRNFVSLLEERV